MSPHAGAQGRVGAVDLVAGDPRRRDTGLHGVGDHRRGQRWLGGKPCRGRDSGCSAAIWILGPGPRQVQRPVYQRVPAGGGVGQKHRDLSVLDAPRGAGVLPLHPDRAAALLHIAGLIDDQHRAGIGERVDDIPAQVIADRVGVPARPGQQVTGARPV
jgi:hypothetical protein